MMGVRGTAKYTSVEGTGSRPQGATGRRQDLGVGDPIHEAHEIPDPVEHGREHQRLLVIDPRGLDPHGIQGRRHLFAFEGGEQGERVGVFCGAMECGHWSRGRRVE